MEPRTPGWIRIDSEREMQLSKSPHYWTLREWYPPKTGGEEVFAETFYPNLQSVIVRCLERSVVDATDLTDVRRLLIVKTKEIIDGMSHLTQKIEPIVRKRSKTQE
jgi:hypothetical protein